MILHSDVFSGDTQVSFGDPWLDDHLLQELCVDFPAHKQAFSLIWLLVLFWSALLIWNCFTADVCFCRNLLVVSDLSTCTKEPCSEVKQLQPDHLSST